VSCDAVTLRPLLLPPLLLCIGNLKIIISISLDLTWKSDTVRLWRILSSICIRSLMTIGCEMKKALVLTTRTTTTRRRTLVASVDPFRGPKINKVARKCLLTATMWRLTRADWAGRFGSIGYTGWAKKWKSDIQGGPKSEPKMLYT